MENKKIDVLFGVIVIAFLIVTIVLIKDFNVRRANDYKEYSATVTNIVRMKNSKIRLLSNLLAQKEKEIADLKGTLTDTRNGLESLDKKLAQPTPVAAPVSVPAPTPAVAVPAPATK